MAFSFSPGQIAPQGSQVIQAPGIQAQGATATSPTGPVSGSPFLFLRERGGTISIMACIQIVLLVAAILSVLITGTLYAYSIYLKSQINSNQEKLLATDAGFPSYPYKEMQRLSKRMAVLDKLLKDYVSPISPLKYLENIVENKVVFDEFKLGRSKGTGFSISFSIITSDYTAIVQQLQALGLAQFHTIAPTPKIGEISNKSSNVKVSVTTPILVQGKLPEEVTFLIPQQPSATSTTSKTVSAQTSPSTAP